MEFSILSMLPLYLLANVHCMGMCGPLTMLLAKNRFRTAYLWGRIVAFTFMGVISGELGHVLMHFLQRFHISFFLSFFFFLLTLCLGMKYLAVFSFPRSRRLETFFITLNQKVSKLMLKENFGAVFCFGAVTILLPCGQSLMVFSFSALLADPLWGGINSLVFSILTSPSLWASMQASRKFFDKAKRFDVIMAMSLFLVSFLALMRSLAEMGWIEHLSLFGNNLPFHLMLY